jgi:hypothetical protein
MVKRWILEPSTKELRVEQFKHVLWEGAMQLPEERWTDEEIVRLTLRWRGSRRKLMEHLVSGKIAAHLWAEFHAHLGNRMRKLLKMTPKFSTVESVTLEDGTKVPLVDLDALWVEDGSGREFGFERYGTNSFNTD